MKNSNEGLSCKLDENFKRVYNNVFGTPYSDAKLPKELVYLINNTSYEIKNIIAAGPCYTTTGYKFFVLTSTEIHLVKVGFLGNKKRTILLSDIKCVKEGKKSFGFKALNVSFFNAKNVFEVFIRPNDAAQRLLSLLTQELELNCKQIDETKINNISVEDNETLFVDEKQKSVDTGIKKESKVGLFAALKKRNSYIEDLEYLLEDKMLTKHEVSCVKNWILSGANAVSYDFDNEYDNFTCFQNTLEDLKSLLDDNKINKNDFNTEKSKLFDVFSIKLKE
ncbi:TPA: hypothetical protein G5V04_003915 [Salmonella enterica]|nr:hypothetical protein [Salmonella enterica]